MIYTVDVVERRGRSVMVSATSKAEAEEKVERMMEEGKVMMTRHHVLDREIEAYDDNGKEVGHGL